MMKRLLKLVAIATVTAAWNPFGRRKAQDATTTTTTTPGTCDASDEACAAAAAEADERLAALERAASVPAGAGRPGTAPQKWNAVAVSADGSRRVALASGGTFANDFSGAGLCGNQISRCAYATVSMRGFLLCFENSMRAIDSSKNQPNRRRFDRDREF